MLAWYVTYKLPTDAINAPKRESVKKRMDGDTIETPKTFLRKEFPNAEQIEVYAATVNKGGNNLYVNVPALVMTFII